ncbi:MAG: hypothetical protein JRH16_17500 [Deltaproteobacteria bacterium]|nr:hypothetical protein [Deltaproteobacteria bacterium]MBW2363371.1 hypothetical protein [Deltaproteobacteria bacterium]
MQPREILPGLWHWTAAHPKIQIEVSTYFVRPARVLLDPLLPPGDGLAWLREHGPPEHVILTNRHHWRHCSEVGAAFDCPVWCNETGLDELEGVEGRERVRSFRAGEKLAGGIESHEVGFLCPDETALHFVLEGGEGCLAVADGVVRIGAGGADDGELAFVPDALIAASPDAVARVKRGLAAAYRRLLDLDWDALLLAHGLPIERGGKDALARFVAC